MYCSKCGKENSEGANFCKHCGEAIALIKKVEKKEDVVEKVIEIDEKVEVSKWKKKIINAGNSIFALGWFMLIVYLGFGSYICYEIGFTDYFLLFIMINIFLLVIFISFIFILLGNRLRKLVDKHLFKYLIIILILSILLMVLSFIGDGKVGGLLLLLVVVYIISSLSAAKLLAKQNSFKQEIQDVKHIFNWYWFGGIVLSFIVFFGAGAYILKYTDIFVNHVDFSLEKQSSTRSEITNKNIVEPLKINKEKKEEQNDEWQQVVADDMSFYAYLPGVAEIESVTTEVEGYLGEVSLDMYVSEDELGSIYSIMKYDYSDIFDKNDDVEFYYEEIISILAEGLGIYRIPDVTEGNYGVDETLDFFVDGGDERGDLFMQGKLIPLSNSDVYLIFIVAENDMFVPGYYQKFLDGFVIH